MTSIHSTHSRLIIFSRYPEPGRVQTRFLTELAPETAARVHRFLTEHTVGTAREAGSAFELELELRSCGADTEAFHRWLGDGLHVRDQGSGDLGERMFESIDQACRDGVQAVLVIGSDCPGLTARHLEQAQAALSDCDLVIGPALDGGYYLIGMGRPIRELFFDMPWGEDEVLATTLRRAEELSLRVKQLDPLGDIDRPEDLALLSQELREAIFGAD